MSGRFKPPAPGRRRVTFNIDLTAEEEAYLHACARIRDVAIKPLARRVLLSVLRDQLIASVLDDETNLRKRAQGEHRYRTAGVDTSPR
jgi:hypothetical protein